MIGDRALRRRVFGPGPQAERGIEHPDATKEPRQPASRFTETGSSRQIHTTAADLAAASGAVT